MIEWLDRLAARTPGLATPPDGLDAALTTLDVDADAATVTAAAEPLVALGVVATGLLAFAVPSRFQFAVVAVGLAAAAAV